MTKIIKHPLIEIKLTVMRDEKTNHKTFRENLNQIGSLMVYEVLSDYEAKIIEVKTPTGSIAKGKALKSEIILVPILRAGLGMTDGLLNLIPEARVGHIGVYRDEKTFEAKEYYYKMPKVAKDSLVIVVDPMLATGASAIDSINTLLKDGFTNIKFVCLVASPEGIKNLETIFPSLQIFTAAIDEKLNDKKYIIPGLGDAGDRIFGTK